MAAKKKESVVDHNAELLKKLDNMEELVKLAREAQLKVSSKKVKSAGTTVRNTMQEIKVLAQSIRVESLQQTKTM